MKPQLRRYYTRSIIRREMVSARKSRRSTIEEASKRVFQEEERRPWMNEPPVEEESDDEREAQGDRQRAARRRSATPIQGSIKEWKFEELISTIHNMIGAMNSMQRQMARHWVSMRIRQDTKPPNDMPKGIW